MNNEEKILSLLVEMQTDLKEMQTKQDKIEQRVAGLEDEFKNLFSYLAKRNEEINTKFASIDEKLDIIQVMQERIEEHEWEIRKIKKRIS
ncbi:MAG: hypothetical protein ACI3ZR_09675 [bacterium]